MKCCSAEKKTEIIKCTAYTSISLPITRRAAFICNRGMWTNIHTAAPGSYLPLLMHSSQNGFQEGCLEVTLVRWTENSNGQTPWLQAMKHSSADISGNVASTPFSVMTLSDQGAC